MPLAKTGTCLGWEGLLSITGALRGGWHLNSVLLEGLEQVTSLAGPACTPRRVGRVTPALLLALSHWVQPAPLKANDNKVLPKRATLHQAFCTTAMQQCNCNACAPAAASGTSLHPSTPGISFLF